MDKFKQLDGNVLIGPQPTEEDLRQAKRQGINTVIDFRMPSETTTPNAELVAKNGLDYANIPVSKASLSPNQIDELDRIMQEKEGPFLLHCASGTRAAMLLVLSRAKKNNWDAERTFEEAKAMGYDMKKFPDFERFVTEMTSR
jgi:uncharacterized protein (TIGR01244 family)